MINTAVLSEFILESQSIHYAVFDRQWQLVLSSKKLATLLSHPAPPGSLLEEVLPEVGGMIPSIEAMLIKGETIEIDHLARPDWKDGNRYMSLRFLPFEDKFLLLIQDTSKFGQVEQRLMQKRNELTLLTSELEKTKGQLVNLASRFLPKQVFDTLMASKEVPVIRGWKRQATIVFADLRGFSHWAEKHSPEETFDTINRFLSQAVEICQTNNGTLDKFMGDGFMALFNAPHDQPDHIQRAVRFAYHVAHLEYHGLRFGVGVHSGLVMAGYIGSEQMLNFTAIGHTVNQAKHIEEAALPGTVLLSEVVARAIAHECEIELFGHLPSGESKEPIPLYRLISIARR